MIVTTLLTATLAMSSPNPMTSQSNIPNIQTVIDQPGRASPKALENMMGGGDTKMKTIYLIRHAESLENVAYKGARRVQAAYVKRQVPEFGDIIDAGKLAFKAFRPSVMNAELSELGRRQVMQIHDSLKNDKFLVDDKKRDFLIVHSPLTRAKQTAYGTMFGPNFLDATAPPPAGMGPDKLQELPALREVNPIEIIKDAINPFSREKTVDRRIRELEQWIDNCEDDTIVMVGHSVYFKRMLDLPETFENCDIWQAEYSADPASREKAVKRAASVSEKTVGLPRSWVSLKRLYRYTPEEIPAVDEEKENMPMIN